MRARDALRGQTRGMARIEVHEDRVVIQLTASEKALAMRRREVVIERAAMTSAIITDDPWIWISGVRSAGTHVPGTLAFGTWRNLGGRDFVLARSKRRAIVIDLDQELAQSGTAAHQAEDDGEFDDFSRVILSTAHAAELITALRLEGDESSVHSTT